jgi:hypothetical protein
MKSVFQSPKNQKQGFFLKLSHYLTKSRESSKVGKYSPKGFRRQKVDEVITVLAEQRKLRRCEV